MRKFFNKPRRSTVDSALFSEEWRKIHRRPSARIAVIALIPVILGLTLNIIFNVYWLKPSDSGEIPTELTGIKAIQAMRKDFKPLEGLLTEEKLEGILAQTQAVYANPDYQRAKGTEITDNAFAEFIQPYRELLQWVNIAYTPSEGVEEPDRFRKVTPSEAENFYRLRQEKLEGELEWRHKIPEGREKNYCLNSSQKVGLPLRFGYAEGWKSLVGLMPNLGLIASFVISLCLAPCYAFEKQCGANAVLLAARYGRTKLNRGKILASFAFASAVFLAVMALAAGIILSVFGAEGGNSSWQTVDFLSFYPLTIWQVWALTLLLGYLGCLLTTSVILLLSAVLPSAFSVIALSTVMIFIQPFLSDSTSNSLWNHILGYLPDRMMTAESLLGHQSYSIFGVIISQPIAVGLGAVFLTTALAWITYQIFSHKQVS